MANHMFSAIQWMKMNCKMSLKEKLSFETFFMQLHMSYATRKCHMYLFFSCIKQVAKDSLLVWGNSGRSTKSACP
jgi:hypothetical protein